LVSALFPAFPPLIPHFLFLFSPPALGEVANKFRGKCLHIYLDETAETAMSFFKVL
jgi:hypothetical protein